MSKLASTLPKGDANGLQAIARDLIDEPHRVHVVLALVDCKKTTVDNDSGEIEPTVRIRRIEAIRGEDLALAQKMLRRALELRTGKTVLPFDLEEDVRNAFRRIDPRTGEIIRDDDGEAGS
jgi:hypothetical protein